MICVFSYAIILYMLPEWYGRTGRKGRPRLPGGDCILVNEHEEKRPTAGPGAGGYTYRKILLVDLEQDRCEVLKSDPSGWQPEEGSLSAQLERFAFSGAIHPEDVGRFLAFSRPDQMRRIPQSGQETTNVLYRRLVGGEYRWNLMEAAPDQSAPGFAVLCVKDVHDVLREGLERESGAKSQELLRSLEDRAYIISSLSSLFFCTYYLDLENDTFRTVTQLRRVEDLLGDEVKCSAALGIYANHFIHPDDREEYLRTISMENLREKLRWWSPCVAVEYRKLSDGPDAQAAGSCQWVRASVVLARTGPDDLPKTAVYVAQDITGGRRA